MKTIINNILSRASFDKGVDTIEVGYPWLTFGAIIALEAIVNKNMRVLEFGSGGSTIFWGRNCKSIKSYETNEKWYNDVKEKIADLENVELIFCQRHMSLELKSEPDNYYDIVLIDCDPKQARRLKLAQLSIPKIKSGGWLIVDNYNKWEMNDFDYSKWQVFTFDEFHYAGLGTRLCKKIF